MLLEAVFRRFQVLKGGKGPIEARATFLESLAGGLVDPPNLELTRANRRFMLGNSAAITGIVCVAALPTTLAQWVIWNADPVRTMFYEELGVYLTAAGAAGNIGGVLLATIFQTPAQTGSNVAGASISPCSKIAGPAGTSQGSAAIVKTSVTITTPAGPNWYPVATNFSPNTSNFATAFSQLERRDLQGAIAVPPGYGLGLSVVAPAGTAPLYAPFARWVELEVDME